MESGLIEIYEEMCQCGNNQNTNTFENNNAEIARTLIKNIIGDSHRPDLKVCEDQEGSDPNQLSVDITAENGNKFRAVLVVSEIIMASDEDEESAITKTAAELAEIEDGSDSKAKDIVNKVTGNGGTRAKQALKRKSDITLKALNKEIDTLEQQVALQGL